MPDATGLFAIIAVLPIVGVLLIMSGSGLLSLLANGEFHSGQDLANALGVSRTAIWKQVNRLNEEHGLTIESSKGKGYRIRGGVDLLDAPEIIAALTEHSRSLLTRLEVLESVDSTNSAVLGLVGEGCSSGLVCTAEQQTAGRGRRGRHWVSPYASNLYLSLLWEFGQGAAALEGLSLAVGVAVVRALEACEVHGVTLKWPNDILYGGAKLGGVLLEMSGDAAGSCQVVIGVGLNVSMPEEATSTIDQAWTDVRRITASPLPNRNQLLAALLNELLPLVSEFESSGFFEWRRAWEALDAYAGKPVILNTGVSRMSGIARGVDERGALQLETSTGIECIYGGEISLRAAH